MENMDKYCNFVPLWLWCEVWDNREVTQVIQRRRRDRIGNRNWWDEKKSMHDYGVLLMLAVECRRHHKFVVVSLCCGSLTFLSTEHKDTDKLRRQDIANKTWFNLSSSYTKLYGIGRKNTKQKKEERSRRRQKKRGKNFKQTNFFPFTLSESWVLVYADNSGTFSLFCAVLCAVCSLGKYICLKNIYKVWAARTTVTETEASTATQSSYKKY